MFFTSPKTLDDAIKPLVLLNCQAGIGMFRQSNQSDTEYYSMQLYTVLATLANWTMISITLTFMAQDTNFYDASPMAFTMYNVFLYTISSITVIGLVSVWLRRMELRDCWQKMLILDDNFQATLGARNEYRKEYIRLTCYAIATIAVMLAISIYNSAWSLRYSQSSFISFCITATMHHPLLVMLVLDLNFRTIVGYIRKKFRDLNNALLRLAQNRDSAFYTDERLAEISQIVPRKMSQRNEINNTETESLINNKHYLLQEIRKAHLELCKLTCQINSIFGMQNLLSTGISFGVITGSLYTIYSAFAWKHVASSASEQIVLSAMWAVIFIIKILMVSHTCWGVSKEEQITGEVIYEFLKLKVYEELECDQIELFALQMIQNPARFDACGFFVLDYTFVQGIIGSITTYFVILIQISELSEDNTTALNIFKNNTGF